MEKMVKVALFADTFHETNGAANFLRRLVNFVKEHDYPFLCIRSGEETKFYQEGSVSFLDLKRSRLSIPIDGALKYDPLMWKHKKLVEKTLEEFKPDVLHVTGLNDVSQFGFYFMHYKSLPALASWHTNTHEYAAARLSQLIFWLPSKLERKINRATENFVMKGLMKLNFLAQMQVAPNQELVNEIQKLTNRPSFLLGRGVDTEFLSPDKRKRTDDKFVIGFVGRLRPEKNVRFLAEIDQAIKKAGINNYEFLIIGSGSEREWLEKNLQNVRFTGEIFGDELAENYANMDLFVFPSQTDAFGNVVLEAMSSGVPAVVMTQGGPKYLIEENVNGFVADEQNFPAMVVNLMKNSTELKTAGIAARRFALENSWNSIFEKNYQYYKMCASYNKDIRASGI